MHIYDKQCEIMQKINGRVQTFRFSVFTMGRQELCGETSLRRNKLLKKMSAHHFRTDIFLYTEKLSYCYERSPGHSFWF